MIDRKKYFDYNATTPLCEPAKAAWLAVVDQHWENPSSLYREAGEARRLLENYREELADELGVDDPERVVFTSGSTEANNAVIQHWSQSEGIIGVSEVEHPCVRASAAGFFGPDRMFEIEVDIETGVIDLDELERRVVLTEGLIGIAVMAANNETGTIQPWDDISDICKRSEVAYLCDAAQWIGKEPSHGMAKIDFLTGSAHKFGGPKGVGFLVLPEDFENCEFIGLLGGPQEGGRRGGTEDLAGIAAMVAALKHKDWLQSFDDGDPRDSFESALVAAGDFKIIGNTGPRLVNTSMIVVPHTKNLKWLTRLSKRGFGVSTGSACSAGAGNPSQVMMAMDLDYDDMAKVLRISGGPDHTKADWMALFEAIIDVKAELEAE